jgi:hypothetical protein
MKLVTYRSKTRLLSPWGYAVHEYEQESRLADTKSRTGRWLFRVCRTTPSHEKEKKRNP